MLGKFNMGLRGKTTLGLGLLIFTSLFFTSAYSYWTSRAHAESNIIALKQAELKMLTHEISMILISERENLLSLRDVPAVQAIIRSRDAGGIDPVSGDSSEQWKKRLEAIFLSFTVNNAPYAQLRYLDAQGNELVRVDAVRGGAEGVSDLQNKAHSLYVSETIKLPAGKIYHSDVNLNRENGVIQQPYTPVLRIATPVYLDGKKVQGLIVINIYTERLFSNVATDSLGVKRFISNEKGEYIKHADAARNFGKELGTGYNLSQDEPELFAKAEKQDDMIRYDNDLREVDGFQKVFFTPDDHSRYWLLGILIPEEVAFASIISERNTSLFSSIIIGLLAMLIILWMTSRKIVAPVVRLAEIAKKMQQGDTIIRADASSVNDEFRILYQTFNEFAANQQKVKEHLETEIVLKTKRHSLIVDSLIDSLITIDKTGTVESFNPASERIFGYSADEVIGHNINMLMPEPYHREHDSYLLNYITTGEKKVIGIGREVVGRRKNGSTFPMELAVSELNVGGERHFTGIVRDISERKASEQYVLDEKARLSAVINNVVDGIITINEEGAIETFNPAATSIFGYCLDEVITQNVKMLMPETYHSEYDDYLFDHSNIGEKKVIGIGREIVGLRKNGSTFPMELAVSTLLIGDQRHFVSIIRDISERKRVEQMQKEFISTVSHELRTPLTSIRGSLGLILGGVVGELPEKVKALLTIANSNSERLIDLINDILDIEKIAAGKMQFEYTVTNLIPVIQKAVESNKGYGDQLNVHFVFDPDENEVVTVSIDEKRIAQVMSNLLSNAAKYSPTHNQVEITVTTEKGHAQIAVHDHGKGIPDEFKSRIFSKFAQADSSDTRQKGGTGLGLSITKAIVEQHGGCIRFESSPDKGTTFYVDLALWQETPKAERKPSDNPSDRPLLLVVEDDQDVSRLLVMMLENGGYRCHQAFNYQEAVQQIQTHQYQAVTLDLMIPGGSGISLLRKLRDDDSTRELPVIVVSAKANEGKLEIKGDVLKVVDWIEKPIDQNRLLESIHKSMVHTQGKGRILHVEDDPDIAMIVGTQLSGEYQVEHASTLMQAKQLINDESFDLVILDIGLPDGSGVDLLPILNSPEHLVPVIIFSAQDLSEDITAQVNGTLVKSRTDNETLMRQIKSTINKKSS